MLLYEFSRFSLCAKFEVVPMHGCAEHWLTIKLLSVLCKVVLRAQSFQNSVKYKDASRKLLHFSKHFLVAYSL
ncbi:hypothetical protein WT23_03465 [Burkholderia territorii]|nr:hypothetical protein WT23_03465 [Burkholderia territorii]